MQWHWLNASCFVGWFLAEVKWSHDSADPFPDLTFMTTQGGRCSSVPDVGTETQQGNDLLRLPSSSGRGSGSPPGLGRLEP